MAKRITIMLDDDLHTKLRKAQADKLKNATNSVSFSQVINEMLRKGCSILDLACQGKMNSSE